MAQLSRHEKFITRQLVCLSFNVWEVNLRHAGVRSRIDAEFSGMKLINDTPTSRDGNNVKMLRDDRTAGRVVCDARSGDKIFIKYQALVWSM